MTRSTFSFDGKAAPQDLELLRQRSRTGARWAAFLNVAMDSGVHGKLIYIHVGEGCTYKEPPKHAPDGSWGAGWKFLFSGYVNLETGEVGPP